MLLWSLRLKGRICNCVSLLKLSMLVEVVGIVRKTSVEI